MGSSGSQTPVTQQTTQTRDPWVGAQPHLLGAMNNADYLFNANLGYQPYTGQTVADLDPTLTQGMAAQQNLATQNLGGTVGVTAGQNAGYDMIKNQGLSPQLQQLLQQQQGQNNPYLQSVLDAQNRQIGDRVNSSMSGSGRYGSGQHTDVMTRALSESQAPLLAQDYQARQQMQQNILQGGLERAGQWAQLMPTLDQAQYAPAQTLTALGQYNQDRAQQQLNDQIKLYNAQQAYPWENVARYNAIIGGAGGLGGTSVTSSPIQQPSTLQKMLGGGLAGAGIGGSFGGPVGAGVGAGVGGLLGML